ncbi:MAG TPA: hypothetical protein VGV61_13070 [Thermoanaerobaculia bacterium]|jgi:hypothetical protein|nr:hypothetical protein [Thermoanaerobaculia bacterium]
MKKLTKSLVPLALVAAGLSASAAPAAEQPRVQSVRIAVADPSTGGELAVLSPGQEITLAPGEEVLLRLFEPTGARRGDRRVLPANSFGFGPTTTPLEIVSSSPERGEALVRLNATPGGVRWHVGYKLADRLVLASEDLRLGRILVRVAGNGSSSITGRSYAPWRYNGNGQYNSYPYSRQVDEVIAALYRGILVRDPDPEAAGFASAVAQRGYDAVLESAHNIADSPESHGRIYDSGVTNEQRLLAIYKQLLGMDRSQIDRRQWDRDLAALSRGDIASVVDAVVRSPQFRSRFGF